MCEPNSTSACPLAQSRTSFLIGSGPALDRSDVDGRLTQHRIRWKLELAKGRQQLEHRLDGGLPEMRVRGMRLASARPYRRAQRALGSTRELALRRLSVYQESAFRAQIVGRARAIGALLLADHEQHVDALLATGDEAVGGHHHGGGNSLGIRRPAPEQARTLQPRRNVGRNRVEMRRERDTSAAPGSRGPDIRAAATHFLERDVPSPGDEPARHEIHGASFRAGRGLNREQLRGERDDICHARKLARRGGRWQDDATATVRNSTVAAPRVRSVR